MTWGDVVAFKPEMIEIRDARADDARQIVELLADLGYDVPSGRVEEHLGQSPERVLVADQGGSLLGLVTVSVQSLLASEGPSARVTAMVVRPTARRGGVGRRLIEAALAHARERGCVGVELTSGLRPEREAAHQFYPALGFRRTSYRYWLPISGSS